MELNYFMNFRKDINGLRAIAVIAVVLFHFNPSWMPGGFAGVDVFFVISGFLMTGIIFRGIENEKFSILSFYVARANRIIPALAALCLVLVIFGWFYLTPLDYRALGKHVGASMGFLSNIIYWKESGYFDAASHNKWLLHTWSLSVEWQFYIIYPLILVMMRKFMSIQVMKKIVLAGMVLGFFYCIVITYWKPSDSYYLLSTRAWEMMVGGVAYLYPFTIQDKRKKLVEWIGLTLILASYIFISQDNPWPGYLAIIPVLGSFFIIQAQRKNSLMTGNFIFQKLGAWSYSIYLWHWPFVVAIYYFSLNEMFIYIGITCSILLGFISNKYIEKLKFRNDFGHVFTYLKCKPLYMTLVVGVIGSAVFVSNGIKWHYSSIVMTASNEENNTNPRRDECLISSGKVPECVYGTGNLGVIVIGDSHAGSIIRSVEKSIPANRSVMDWTMHSCNTIKEMYNFRNGILNPSCGDFVSYALEEVKKYPKVPIVIMNRHSAMLFGGNEPEFAHSITKIQKLIPLDEIIDKRNTKYFNIMNNAFFDTVCEFSQNNPVFLLQQTPEMKYQVPKKMAKELMKGNANYRVKLPIDEYHQRHEMFEAVAKKLQNECNVTYIPVEDKFCDEQFCYGDINGRPLFIDDDHLSEFGASNLIPVFKELITLYLP